MDEKNISYFIVICIGIAAILAILMLSAPRRISSIETDEIPTGGAYAKCTSYSKLALEYFFKAVTEDYPENRLMFMNRARRYEKLASDACNGFTLPYERKASDCTTFSELAIEWSNKASAESSSVKKAIYITNAEKYEALAGKYCDEFTEE